MANCELTISFNITLEGDGNIHCTEEERHSDRNNYTRDLLPSSYSLQALKVGVS